MKIRRVTKIILGILTIFAGVFLLGILVLRSYDTHLPKGKAYKVLSDNDFSSHGRTRIDRGIATSATSMEERTQIAMQAALDLQKSSGADVVSIWLEINQDRAATSRQLTIIRYAPDGKGYSGSQDWQYAVEATNQNIGPFETQVGDLWYRYQEDYWDRNGKFDEEGLKTFISRELGVSVDQVTLPWIARITY